MVADVAGVLFGGGGRRGAARDGDTSVERSGGCGHVCVDSTAVGRVRARADSTAGGQSGTGACG